MSLKRERCRGEVIMQKQGLLISVVSLVLAGPACKVSTSGFTSGGGTSGGGGGGGGGASRPIVIPDLFRMTKDEAVAALERAGFDGTISWDDQLCGSVVEGQIIEKGEVCRQHPPAGREQGSRLPISILVQPEDPRHGKVGEFGEWHLMPDVVGMHVDKARAAMRAAGFTEERTRISVREEAGCKPHHVCSTYPEALKRSGQGSDRVLVVGADPTAKAPEAKPEAKPEEKPGSYF
ncbi:MAG: PASTA domain-containing protein [Kofleriaceae bacterium]|nr:MAG: PASTA domain-containing protein [Kofleriaceae bacterium]